MDSLYAKDQAVPFEQIFSNPSSLYRDTPFWAWNCKLEEQQLRRQIAIFQEMGMGGFHMHSRTGMGTSYLAKDFMERVDDCVDEAKKRNMLAWLYDEDRWPSGAAGGIVTKNPKFRARHLEIRFKPLDTPPNPENDNSGRLLACYLIRLDADGCLAKYIKCDEQKEVPLDFRKIYCYLMVSNKDSWYNDQTYVDTLNPRAIKEFVNVTHEAYRKKIGKEFDKTVPAIFTDEPQFTRKSSLTFAREEKIVNLPFTDDFPETYKAAYKVDFYDTLPELVWELPNGKYSLARYRFHDHVAERFASAFADTIGDWCQKNNLRSTGHMMEEPTLTSQTAALGEAMRSYRGFLLPGIDTLCDCQELSTAKQAQSASRQFGRGGVLSELDGVTDWDFNFMGHKGHGDWQAALGVTVRVPHLSWVSMAGEAKRDYPASIHYQSSWYKKYPVIADHFARVNAAMTRGKAVSHIAVIHPVESFWLLWGPLDQTSVARQQAEENFGNLFEWLLKGLLDFDLLSESLLPIQNVHVEDKELCVGEMKYSTILVPPCITLRASTLKFLEEFRAAGGDVIFAGDVAPLCDAEPSKRASKLAANCRRTMFTRAALLAALDSRRELKVLSKARGSAMGGLLYQLREQDGIRYLFLTRTDRYGTVETSRVMLKGSWQLDFLNTADGSITPLQADIANGWTTVETEIYPHGHLLLRLTPSDKSCGESIPRFPINQGLIEAAVAARVSGACVPITLDEPNVLVLDEPEWNLNDGEWQPAEEILRLDNRARALMGLRPKTGHIVQPWVYPVSPKVHGRLAMKFKIHSEAYIEKPFLALEQPEQSSIFFDNKLLTFKDEGYWTDECVRKMTLPPVTPGDHVIQIIRDYRDDTNIERMYILGDFGVVVAGNRLTITEPVRTLHWGDVAPQGLPFYGGNITYHASFSLAEDMDAAIRFPSRQADISPELCGRQAAREIDFVSFHGTLVSLGIDGKPAGDIAFSPFQLPLGRLAAGDHQLDITLFGNRENSFGPIHLNGRIRWIGPNAWRTAGDMFTYDYALRPLGINASPFILKA
ncbi:MAG: hypothetical protein IKP58_08005 [Victivallales bacterium]|nr:hypothetical protein [Victivallales bacterium]